MKTQYIYCCCCRMKNVCIFSFCLFGKTQKTESKSMKEKHGKNYNDNHMIFVIVTQHLQKKIYKTYYSITIRYILTHLCSNIGPWLPIQHSYLNNGHFLLISIFWLYSVFLSTFHIHTNITPTQRYFLSIQLTKKT